MTYSPAFLRQQAQHCRDLAKLLTDREAVTELQKFAGIFQAEAERLEAPEVPMKERNADSLHEPAAVAMEEPRLEDAMKKSED